jgi:hypothetical protein
MVEMECDERIARKINDLEQEQGERVMRKTKDIKSGRQETGVRKNNKRTRTRVTGN